jgi:putative membrane protein
VQVEIKTAAGTQAVMSAVTQAKAEQLRLALGVRDGSEHALVSEPADFAHFELSFNELLLAASTSGRLGVLLSGVAYLYSQVDDFIEERLLEFLAATEFDTLPTSSPWFLAGTIMLGLSLAFLVSVAAEVARFSGFAVTRTGDQLVIRRGLFERREVSLSLDRIQAVRIVESVPRQPLGYASIIVDTAGQSEESSRSIALHPFIHRSRWQTLLSELIPQYAVTPQLISAPSRALRRFMVRPIVLAVLVAAALAGTFSFGWIAFTLVPLSVWFGVLAHRDAAAGGDTDTLVLRERRFWRSTAIVKRRRVQLVELSSSFLQRRLRLSDFCIGVASATGGKRFRVSNLDTEDAENLAERSLAPRPSQREVRDVTGNAESRRTVE